MKLSILFVAGWLALTVAPSSTIARPAPVKVFVLVGQSNMQGQAVVDLAGRDYNEGKGTLAYVLADPAKGERFRSYGKVKGAWPVWKDVWVRYQPEDQPVRLGPLSVGFAVYEGRHHFGPELGFGRVVGERFENPVVLVKTAWGGKSLKVDFRPPSSGGEVGPYYRKTLDEVRLALTRIPTEFPELKDRPVELAGLVWYQGWNDGIDKKAVAEYEQNLVNLINDLRRDLNAPKLPIVVGELTGAWVDAPEPWTKLRKAQAAAAARPEFRGNVAFVETREFVRKPEDSPNPGHGHHEFGNAETYLLVGEALGRGMIGLTTAGGPDR